MKRFFYIVMIPVRRHIWRWTSERERDKPVLVWLQCQGSAVSETTKLETHVRMCSHPTSDFCKSRNYWVSSHTSNFSTIGQSDPEIRKRGRGGVHVRTCRDTPPMTCVNHLQLVHDLQLKHQNWIQSAKPFLRYRSVVCTCARAEIPHPWLLHALQLMGPQLHTKFQHNQPSRYRDKVGGTFVTPFRRHAPRATVVEVFTGPIFSPNSSPPHEPGSKSIPPQMQNWMGQPPQSILK